MHGLVRESRARKPTHSPRFFDPINTTEKVFDRLKRSERSEMMGICLQIIDDISWRLK